MCLSPHRYMDQVVLEKPKPKCSAGRSKVNISSSPVRSTTGLSARPPPVLVHLLGLKLICHLFSQFSSAVRSSCNSWLSMDKHVDNVAAKGNRTLGFIRRNLKDCTRTVKETSYTAIVRPTIEYAATVWDPDLLGATLMTVHLLGLKLICHLFSQFSSAFRSSCNSWLSIVPFMARNKMVLLRHSTRSHMPDYCTNFRTMELTTTPLHGSSHSWKTETKM
jgi:hypothetical protein